MYGEVIINIKLTVVLQPTSNEEVEDSDTVVLRAIPRDASGSVHARPHTIP